MSKTMQAGMYIVVAGRVVEGDFIIKRTIGQSAVYRTYIILYYYYDQIRTGGVQINKTILSIPRGIMSVYIKEHAYIYLKSQNKNFAQKKG